MFNKNLKLLLSFSLIFFAQKIYPRPGFPINIFENYDVNLRPAKFPGQQVEVGTLAEGSLFIKGRNTQKCEVDVLQIWNSNQNTLTMLRGFSPESEIGKFAIQFNGINDEGNRGHLLPTSDLSIKGYSFFAYYYLPHDFNLGFFLPFYSMKLRNVQFEDLTKNITAQDRFVREELTSKIKQIAADLGGLDLNGWERNGPGDGIVQLQWYKNFPQGKQWLKNVALNFRVGLTIPFGLRKNEDQVFSIPFGYDGSWGILFAGGLDLNWWHYLSGGIDAEFVQLFGNTKDRRIKTNHDQTELLLLAKTKVFKEPGIYQRFNLYLEAHKFIHGLSFRIAYQFLKNTDDKYWLFDNQYSSNIANTSQILQHWTLHQFVFALNYDMQDDLECPNAVPRFSLFYKLPFNGTRSVQVHSIGAAFSMAF